MPFWLLIFALPLVIVVCFFQHAPFVWLCGRIFEIPTATWRRSLLISLALTLALTAVGLVFRFVAPNGDLSLAAALGQWCALLMIMLATGTLVVKTLLKTNRGKAFIVFVITLLCGSACSFLLALVVLRFVVEAFVVPTGALATTIVGAHADVACENCGFPYAISMSDYYDPDGAPVAGIEHEQVVKFCVCPNCRFEQKLRIVNPPSKGDRILCDKNTSPRRWDLVVFHFPPTGSDLSEYPELDGGRTRYVMRLVGLPGETLKLVEGDVFIDGHRLQKLPHEAEDLWFLVHDAQYVPQNGEPVWKPAERSHWQFREGTWTIDATAESDEELVLTRPISDFQAYNVASSSPLGSFVPEVHPMGDVKLACEIGEYSGAGGFGFRWYYFGQEIIAHVSAAGDVSLEASGTAQFANDSLRIQSPRPLAAGQKWEFAVRDGRVYVAQDKELLASRLVGSRSPDGDTGPPKAWKEPGVSIFARQCSLILSKLQLYRDVYYVSGTFGAEDPNHQYRLGAGEYFMLGDNSGRSSDSRVWGPARQEDLIGVVRCIWWPPSRSRSF
jgi:signal peptidase I